jgi:hypothetical protein
MTTDNPTVRAELHLDRLTADEVAIALGMIHAAKQGLPLYLLPDQKLVVERLERKLVLHRDAAPGPVPALLEVRDDLVLAAKEPHEPAVDHLIDALIRIVDYLDGGAKWQPPKEIA